jgi:hypothetical protein
LLFCPNIFSSTPFSKHPSSVSGEHKFFQKPGNHLKTLDARRVTMKHVPQQGPTNIRCHGTKFSFPGGSSCGICALHTARDQVSQPNRTHAKLVLHIFTLYRTLFFSRHYARSFLFPCTNKSVACRLATLQMMATCVPRHILVQQ